MELSPRAPSPPRWTSSQRSAGHRKLLLRPHVSLLQRLPAGALKQARSSQPGHSHVLEARALTALRRESARQLVTQPSLRAERPAPAVQRRFGAPCGPPEQSGQPRAHTAQRAPPEAALRERSDWKPKPKWSRTAPRPSSRHGKKQSEPV